MSESPRETPAPSGRKSLLPQISRPRMLFFGFWGSLVLFVLIATRAVLLPFFLAVVVAYVFSPLVAWLQTRKLGSWSPPRWVAVVFLYMTLLAGLAGFVAVGVPRLAAEIELLARELPETVAQIRDEWVPELEARLRSAMRESTDDVPEHEAARQAQDEADHADEVDGATTPGQGEESAPVDGAEGVEEAPIDREHIEVRALADGGGYRIDLPEHGLVVQPAGHGYRVTSQRRDQDKDQDLTQTLSNALEGMATDTRSTASALLQTAQAVVRAVVKGVFTFFIMLMLSAYLLITSDRILSFFRSMWPTRRQRSFDRLVIRIDRGLAGVVRGQLLIALVNGILSGLGFYLLELRYWPILTVVATLLSVIPIFGAIISTVPAVVIALQSGVSTALFTLLWIIGIHQIEANLLNPKIMGDSAKVHPVLVIFALLAGETLFGIAGALLAVPMLSIVQSLFLHYRELMLGVPKKADASSSDGSVGPIPASEA